MRPVWAETDLGQWLEASDLFNHHFPKFLGELLDDALGGTANTELAEFGELLGWLGGTQAVGRAMVAEQDPKKLRTAAKAATKAKKAETAKWLERVAGDWTRIRAWIEGVVMYKKGGWSYTSEHETRVAGRQGEARGQGRAARPDPAAPEARGDARGGRLDLADRQHRGQGLHALRGSQGLRGDQEEEEVKAPTGIEPV